MWRPLQKNSIAVCPKFDFSLIAVEDKVNLLNIYIVFFIIFEDFLHDRLLKIENQAFSPLLIWLLPNPLSCQQVVTFSIFLYVVGGAFFRWPRDMRTCIAVWRQRKELLHYVIFRSCPSSKKNLRKVRTECMRQIKNAPKTKSVRRARGKLILLSTAAKPLAVCPGSNHC